MLETIIKRFESLRTKRSYYDTTFQDIADLVLINRGNFSSKTLANKPEINKVFNNTAIEAMNRFIGVVINGLTNIGSRWVNIKLKKHVNNSVTVNRWTDLVTDHLLSIFNSSSSGFYTHHHTALKSWSSFGTGCLYAEETDDGAVKFCTVHLSELYIAENTYGEVDTVFRNFTQTASQVVERWPETVSWEIAKKAQEDPDATVELLHYVRPKDKNTKSAKLAKFEYISTYIDLNTKKVLSEKGYYKMPYIITRYDVFTGEAYGRSPVWDCLNEIKMLNVMLKDIIKAGQLSAIPPILTTGDNLLPDISLSPGVILDGALSYDGSPNIATLDIKANLPFAMELIQFSITRIRESFSVDQMYFKEGTPVTATEAVQRDTARLQVISPMVVRLMSEYLNPLIELVFDIEYRAGRIPPAPEEVKDIKLDIEYVSPLANLQRMQDIQALQRTWAVIAPVAQVDPTIFDAIKFADAGTYVAQASGVPASLIRTQKELAEIMQARQAQQQQQQMQQQLAAFAPQLGKPIQ